MENTMNADAYKNDPFKVLSNGLQEMISGIVTLQISLASAQAKIKELEQQLEVNNIELNNYRESARKDLECIGINN